MTADATVLLVDDEQAVLNGLRRALREEPWDLICATSAEAALRILDERDVDIVVSDQDMPGTRGTAFLAAVRERAPDVGRLMLTGRATLETAVEAINAGGVSQFLVKPMDGPSLATAIRRTMQERVVTLAVQSSHPVLLVEAQTRLVLHASGAAERLLGGAAIKGHDARDVLTASGLCEPAEVDERLASADGRPWRLRCGGAEPIEIEARVWRAPAYDRAVCVTLQDVTQHARLERQVVDLRKSELAGQVASGVLHDLNNLLTVIGGQSQLLRAEHDGGARGRNVDAIQSTVEHAGALSRQLMRFLRTGRLDLEDVDLNAMLQTLVLFLRQVLPPAVQLELDLAEDVAPVETNRAQLEQVVLNLAINARDAMPDGGHLVVRTAMTEGGEPAANGVPPGRLVLLEVVDSGCGMTDEIRRRLFEPFFTTKGTQGGTGLGLPTVAAIVRRYHGHIEVESEVGRGTRFSVYLPAARRCRA